MDFTVKCFKSLYRAIGDGITLRINPFSRMFLSTKNDQHIKRFNLMIEIIFDSFYSNFVICLFIFLLFINYLK